MRLTTDDGRRTTGASWTIDLALNWGRARLAGTDEIELAAKRLLAHVLQCTLSELFAYPDRRLTAAQGAAYRALVERRARHEPLAYLVGHCGFLELDLLVDRRALIPRPETELLVELALAWVQRGHRDAPTTQAPKQRSSGRPGHGDAPPTDVSRKCGRGISRECGSGIPMPRSGRLGHGDAPPTDVSKECGSGIPMPRSGRSGHRNASSTDRLLRIADVGTGSGAIAIGLAAALPQARIFALDRSPGALELARQNAARCGVADRIAFLQGDLLAPLPGPVELIVANLPYVSEDEYAALPPGIRAYEPRAALVAGPDGLDAIRRLLQTARPHLAPAAERAAILLEIGASQGEAVSALAAQAFPEARVEVIADYGGRDRVVKIEFEL